MFITPNRRVTARRYIWMPKAVVRAAVLELFAFALAGIVSAPAAAERLVTAVRDGSGDLTLIAWNVDDSGNVERRGAAGGGGVSLIAATPLTEDRVVTAVRDGGGNLKVIVWDVSANGNVTRRGDARAGAVSRIALASLGNTRLATCVRDRGGNLKVIVWDVLANGTLTRRGDASAGAVSEISTVNGYGRRLITAVRDAGGNLKLITWRVTANGNVTREGDARAGTASALNLARAMHVDINQGADRVVTAVRDGGGNLKLIAWEITPQGAIKREGDARADAVSRIAAVNLGGFGTDSSGIGTAVRDSGGNLKVLFWEVGFASDQTLPVGAIELNSHSGAGAVSRIAATGVGPGSRFATAVQDSGGHLKVIVWQPLNDMQARRLGDARAGAVSEISVVALP